MEQATSNMARYNSWPEHKKLNYQLKSHAVPENVFIGYFVVLVILVIIIFVMADASFFKRFLIVAATAAIGVMVFKIIERMLCHKLVRKIQHSLSITRDDPQYVSKMLAELSKL